MTAVSNPTGNGVFVEVGFSALRDEEGKFLPAVPLFIQVPAEEINQHGQSPGEVELTDSISQILAEKFGQYIQGVKAESKNQHERGLICRGWLYHAQV